MSQQPKTKRRPRRKPIEWLRERPPRFKRRVRALAELSQQ